MLGNPNPEVTAAAINYCYVPDRAPGAYLYPLIVKRGRNWGLHRLSNLYTVLPGSPGGTAVKNQETMGLIPGSGWITGERMGTHCSILAWKIPRTEEPGRLKSMESQSWTWLSTAEQKIVLPGLQLRMAVSFFPYSTKLPVNANQSVNFFRSFYLVGLCSIIK